MTDCSTPADARRIARAPAVLHLLMACGLSVLCCGNPSAQDASQPEDSGHAPAGAPETSCSALAGLDIPDARILSATRETEPTDHCKVTGLVGGKIGFKVWLPVAWNGRFVMGDAGGFVNLGVNQALQLLGEQILAEGYPYLPRFSQHSIRPAALLAQLGPPVVPSIPFAYGTPLAASLRRRSLQPTDHPANKDNNMGLYRSASGTFEAVASIDDHQGQIDVFVSHKSDDEDKAKEVAACIDSYGLRPWLDVTDLRDEEDDEAMVDRIEAAITRSLCLMAVVTDVTNESWWVPFEIGLAYDMDKQLASYCEEQQDVEIPSFLWRWPLVQDHDDLHEWCDKMKLMKSDKYLTEAATLAATIGEKTVYRRSLANVRNSLNRRRPPRR